MLARAWLFAATTAVAGCFDFAFQPGGEGGAGGTSVSTASGAGVSTVVASSNGVGMSSSGGGAATSSGTGSSTVAESSSSVGSSGQGGTGGAGPCGGVDLQTDEDNCGACGHDCLGGACLVGRCQPTVLAEHLGLRVRHLDLDEAAGVLFYTTDDVAQTVFELRSVATDGTNDGLVNTEPLTDCDFVRAGDDVVYLTGDSGWVGFVERASGAVVDIAELGGIPVGFGLSHGTSDGVHQTEFAYLHAHGEFGEVLYVYDYSAPFTAPSSVEAAIAAPQNQSFGFGIATDPLNVADMYWSTWGANADDGTIVWRPSFANVHIISDIEAKPSGIALDETHVYWIDAHEGIWRHLRGDPADATTPPPGTPESVVIGEGDLAGQGGIVALDDTHVYWTTTEGVYRAPKVVGSSAERLFEIVGATDLVLDDVAMYFTDFDAGQVLKLAK